MTTWDQIYLNTTVGGAIVVGAACVGLIIGYSVQYILRKRGK